MTKKIILKSTHPEEYPDLEIECKVIPNAEIGAYVASIPEERKFTAYKSAPVEARRGVVGEKIVTTLKVMLAGKEYILKEETGIVKERTYQSEEKEITEPDVVVTNVSSTSSEEYIVKHEKFTKTYSPIGYSESLPGSLLFKPAYDPRAFAQVTEPVIIVTLWGSEAICLPGSYIVTYDAASSDYNTVEAGAFKSTYTVESTPAKKRIR